MKLKRPLDGHYYVPFKWQSCQLPRHFTVSVKVEEKTLIENTINQYRIDILQEMLIRAEQDPVKKSPMQELFIKV